MRALVIVNMHAGGGDAGIYDYARALGIQGGEVTLRFASVGTRIEPLLHDAGEYDVVVAAGGDGTVSAVCYATRGRGVPVLAYPAGTANLLAMNLGLPLDPVQLARVTTSGVPVAFDVGELVQTGAEDRPATGFMVMAGAGYDAAIMESAQPLKSVFGPAAYLLAAIGNIAPTVSTFDIVVDGVETTTEGIAVLLVNFGKIQFDLAVAPGWDPKDGQLDVAVVRTRNAAGLLPVVFAAMLDKMGEYPDTTPGIEIHRGSTVSVSARPALRMQYDGEALEALTPFTARCLHRQATLLVPADSPFATENRT